MSGLDRGHRGERPADERLGLLIAAGQLEGDDDRAAVLGADRALDPGDALDAPQAADDVGQPGGVGRATCELQREEDVGPGVERGEQVEGLEEEDDPLAAQPGQGAVVQRG